MALEALPSSPGVSRILIQDAPGAQHGVCLFIWDSSQSPIPMRECRQVDIESAKRFCLEYYDVPESAWHQVPDEDLSKARNMPLWYKTYRKKNPWTWFT